MRCTVDCDFKVDAVSMLNRMIDETKQLPEIWLSPRGQGFHFIAYGLDCSFEETLKMRERIGDDYLRIKIDRERCETGKPLQVLWTKKIMDGVEYNARKLTLEEFIREVKS